MFRKAIVKAPCKNMVKGITSVDLGLPDYRKALEQHKMYVEALQRCGLDVIVLEADENFPDSVFVEDTAALCPDFAIICNPGDETRNSEPAFIEAEIGRHYSNVYKINFPCTIDGGDVMMIDKHFYIGLSDRTNNEGAKQFIEILEKYNCTGSLISLNEVLHLKTGVNYLENNNLLVCGEFVEKPEFEKFNKIIIPKYEAYAANSLWVNNKVLVPFGFPETLRLIKNAGYETLTVDVSEFQKLDGGLSCLSLRF